MTNETAAYEPDRRGATATENRILLLTRLSGLLLTTLSVIIWYAVTASVDRLSSVDDSMHEISMSVSSLRAYMDSHEREKDIWVSRILSNAAAIGELKTNANARKDPFTGTEGRKLERRIDVLERHTK